MQWHLVAKGKQYNIKKRAYLELANSHRWVWIRQEHEWRHSREVTQGTPQVSYLIFPRSLLEAEVVA